MTTLGRACAVGAAFAMTLATPAFGVTLGATDTFADGSMNGWTSGDVNPNGPVNVAGGGAGGSGDAYLLLTATGVPGPGGKLVAFGGGQWSGDYVAAGVSGIEMDLANFGATTLNLRLYLAGAPGIVAISNDAVTLAAGSGWTHAFFALAPEVLVGGASGVLGGVTQLRLFDSDSAIYPGPVRAALLGVDNVSAVPEPDARWLLGAGVLMLTLRRRLTANS